MTDPRGDDAYGHGEGVGLITAWRGSLFTDEYQASPRENAAATESKEPLVGTVECKGRTLGLREKPPLKLV
ncbi:hypothetical protein NDU88_002797 [Pleurodeles waltl]|uniref:Uncharacterized protein n=1 Tax=Pleurodeles waltl TaxID=8319 RepID=A0AAV7TPB3_PLEWA|nr:hypothetical protein NDU88_002797 [Pleurodeles waltl]